uniref:Phospholipid/glycerol acyltransferase domain-containing protein n=1 Tax=Ditylenchus dipsaci TaxID=166011 RepID=A0A915D7X6_9BILA
MSNASSTTSLDSNISNGPNGKKSSRVEKPPGSRSKWSQATTKEKVWWLIIAPVRAILCFSNVFVFFLTYFGLMLPVLWAKPLWPRFYWFYEGKLYMWLQAFIGYWGYTADYDVYEFGDDITQYCEKDRILIICNHQSTADVPTLFSVLQSKGVATRKTLWLMDVMFRWTPFGIIGNMHGDYFIQQGKATRDKELIRLKEHLQKVFWDRDRRWVILFPEGGFYYNRVESSQRYAKLHGYPHLQWTTLPRMGAVKTILEEVGPRMDEDGGMTKSQSTSRFKLLKDTVDAIREKKYVKDTRPPIKYVLDVTIAYPNGEPLSLATMMFGTREKCDIAVNYKIHKASDVPFHDDEALQKWMYDVYVEKDRILDNYYKHGAFHVGETGHRIVFAWSRIIMMYAFWISAAAIQYKLYPWLLYQMVAFLKA